MAASAEKKDYVHLMLAEITQTAGRKPQSMVSNIAEFERRYETYDIAVSLKRELAFQADLVILAIGENTPALTTQRSAEAFRTHVERLLRKFQQAGASTIVVRSCFWPDSTKDASLAAACRAVSGIFVNISPLIRDPANQARSERKFAHDGVAGHPGDRGMRALADALLHALLRPSAPARRVSLERIRPSKDGRHFVGASSGQRFVAYGVNYDHDDAGRLLEDYRDKEWGTVAEDFGEIKALGANVVRIHLQLGKFFEAANRPNKTNLARLGQLVRLAEETGLYLDVTGLGCYHKKDVPPWYDKLDEAGRWDVQEQFWQAVAGVCKDSPAIFCYDLMNEPILPGEKKKETEWLAGELGDKFFVQRITLNLAGRSREEVAKQWVKKLTTAIRKVDDRHMITVGVIPWAYVFKGAKPLFNAPGVGDPLDFVSVHFYPKKGDVEGALAALKVYAVGKPLVVEEIFPLGCSIEETGKFIDGSRAFCDGWVSFYWGKTIEENEKAGNLKGAVIAQWLRYFRAKAPDILGGGKK